MKTSNLINIFLSLNFILSPLIPIFSNPVRCNTLSPKTILAEQTVPVQKMIIEQRKEINMKRGIEESNKILAAWTIDLETIKNRKTAFKSIEYFKWTKYLKWSFFIIQNLPISPNYGDYLDEVKDIWDELYLLLNETYKVLFYSLDEVKNPNKKNQILLILSRMNDNISYISDMIVAIETWSFIDIFSGYTLPKTHYFERFLFIGPLIRLFWGMTANVWFAKKQLGNTLLSLIDNGNKIVPHLYPEDIEDHLSKIKSKNQKRIYALKALGIQEYINNLLSGKQIKLKSKIAWIMRKQLTRFIPIPIAFLTLLWKGVGLSIILSFGFFLLGFSRTFFARIGTYYNILSRNKILRRTLQVMDSTIYEDFNQALFNVSFEYNWDKIEKELISGDSTTDIIIICTGPDTNNIAQLSEEILSSPYIRKDVPVIFVPNKKWGSGWAFLNLFKYLKPGKPSGSLIKNFMKDKNIALHNPHLFKDSGKYPHLLDKNKEQNVEDLRILTLFAGHSDPNSLIKPFRLPVKKKVIIKPFELACLNGYLSSRKLKDQNKSGITIVNPSLGYLGPVEVKGDITITSVLLDKKIIAKNGLGLVYEDLVDGNVRKILRYPHEEILMRKNTLANLGPIIISFTKKDKKRYIETINFFNEIKNVLSQKKQTPPIRLISDIIVPFVILSSEPESLFPTISQRMATYFIIRIKEHIETISTTANDRKKIREFYFSLLEYLEEKFPTLISPYNIKSNAQYNDLVRTFNQSEALFKKAA